MSTWVQSTTLADAQRVRQGLAAAADRHLSGCADCRRASGMLAWYCPVGWDLAKQLAAARADVARLEAPPPADQGELF